MHPFFAGFVVALLLGLPCGIVIGALFMRRAIALNLRRLAESPALTLYNTDARKLNLKPQQIARRALRDAAIVAAGAKEEGADAQ